MTCWHHISGFNNFQQTVLLLQANLSKEAKVINEPNRRKRDQGAADTILIDDDDDEDDDVTEIKNIELIDQVSESSANGFGSGQLIVTDDSVRFETDVGNMSDTIAMAEDARFALGEGERKVFSQDEEYTTNGDVFIVDEYEDWANSDNSMELMPQEAGTLDSRSIVISPERPTIKKSVKEMDAVIAKWMPILDCHVCTKTYTTFTQIKQHFQEDHPGGEFYVMCCERKLKYRFRAEEHAILHMDPNAFKCSLCDKILKSKNCLKSHMVHIHASEFKHVCETCGKCFRLESALREHRKSHTRKPTHACRYCESMFTDRNGLTHHIKYVHPDEKQEIIRNCKLCPQTFTYRTGLYHHLMRHHPEEFAKRKRRDPAQN